MSRSARRRQWSSTGTADVSLLEVSEVFMRFGGVSALDGASFRLEEGQICGLIGPNGAGKTTLFNCISGLYHPQRGHIRFGDLELLDVAPHRVATLGIARTFQNLGLFPTMTVLDNVMIGGHPRTRAGYLAGALRLPSVRVEERGLREGAEAALDSLGLGGVAGSLAVGLPYGTLKRIELARALMARPRLLLLDEPASGLSHIEVDELVATILRVRNDFSLSVLLVEHHMAMLMRLSDKVVAMDLGRTIAEGTPKEVQSDPGVIAAYLGTAA